MEIIHNKIGKLFKVPRNWIKNAKFNKDDLLIRRHENHEQEDAGENTPPVSKKISLYKMRENVTISITEGRTM